MKKNISRILGFFLAFSIFLCPCAVFASSVPNYSTYSSYDSELTSEYVEAFYSNSYVMALGYTNSNSVLVYDAGSKYVTCMKIDNTLHVSTAQRNNVTYDVIYCSGANCISSYFNSSLSSLNTFRFTNYVNAGYIYPTIVKVNSSFYCTNYIEPNNLNRLTMDNPNSNYDCFFINGDYVAPFVPDGYELVNPFFSLDIDDFYTWLVNNDKIDISGSTGGISVGGKIPSYIGTQKLKSFLEFYKNFGASNQSFVKHIFDWLSYMNIVGQTRDNVKVLKATTDQLYQEYINYRSGTHAYWPTATKLRERQDIDTLTDDNNTVLITDDNTDTVDISLLRDILRGVIAISNNLNQGVSDICSVLERLDFTVNLANNGGEFVGTDLSVLYEYNSNDFNDDLETFEDNIENIQNIPQGYIDTINQNELMPENMLEDKNSLSVNVPCITGYTIGNNGNTYSTQTGTYTLNSSDFPWLDPIVQKIKRFGSILLIIGYLVHLRYRIPELVRGE